MHLKKMEVFLQSRHVSNKMKLNCIFCSMELNLFLLILFLHLSHLSFALITPSKEPLCNELEQVALLQFKNSFSLDQALYQTNKETNSTTDCCSWKGVTCEVNSGHVTDLDLSYGSLYGAIDSTNPIFRMTRLQKLNLAGNDFAQSEIPSALGSFSMLKSLNLSQASFSGSIPREILALSSLTSLDLSGNPLLHLPSDGLSSIAHNMKDLTELRLSQINISSAMPATFANMTSLRMLQLQNCSLQDHFPVKIFLLPRLEHLNLTNNPRLYGYLPDFPIQRTSLRSLDLSFTKFQGELPGSIGNLISLQMLDISYCNFSGSIPYTIGNLVNITKLQFSDNSFSGPIPSSLENLTSLTNISLAYNPFSPNGFSWIGKLTNLKWLDLSSTNVNGSIPSSLRKLHQIEGLSLNYNLLSGQIPSWIGNLTQLGKLRLAGNNLEGQIPSSIFSLKNLYHLNLRLNNLRGTVDISMFHEQKNINSLKLSSNHLTVVSRKFLNFSLPNLELLALDSCNLKEFPLFLKKQDRLKLLSLGANNISGELPAWFLNVSTKTLTFLDLSYNFLTRFDRPLADLPWSKLEVLDLSFNNINGSLPLPPQSITFYSLSNNSLGGELSPTFCKCNTLFLLDLSNNKLNGAIPECLGNLSSSLKVWNFEGNRFEGKIPNINTDNCSLQWINLSQNQLRGKLPRTLAKCTNLIRLDAGNNHLADTFPSWLGGLPNLQVLILKDNIFHGPMRSPSSMTDFPELRILDLSNNALTGALPSQYFSLWKAMMITTQKQLSYLQVNMTSSVYVANANWTGYYHNYSMNTEINDKGVDMEYRKLSNIMVFLSLSGNKFVGEIPKSIGDLVGLVGLNLSNNNLIGSIPPALGELKQLESLDLSLNMLSGEIPQGFSQLTFLEYLNVSYNNLSGRIPGGEQFGTFGNTSFNANPGLCGFPLLNKCGGANEPSQSHEDRDHGSSDHTMLVLVLEGFLAGLVIGLSSGYIITARNHQWFVKTSLMLRCKFEKLRNRTRYALK